MADLNEDAVESTESVLDLQELSTEDQADDVQAHGFCISINSLLLDVPTPL